MRNRKLSHFEEGQTAEWNKMKQKAKEKHLKEQAHTHTHTHTAVIVTRSAKHRNWKMEKLRVTMQ